MSKPYRAARLAVSFSNITPTVFPQPGNMSTPAVRRLLANGGITAT